MDAVFSFGLAAYKRSPKRRHPSSNHLVDVSPDLHPPHLLHPRPTRDPPDAGNQWLREATEELPTLGAAGGWRLSQL